MFGSIMKLLDAIEYNITKVLTALPVKWQIKLSGEPPVVIGGEALHPEIQLLISLRKKARHKNFHSLGVDGSRKYMRRTSAIFGGAVLPVKKVTNKIIQFGEHKIKTRHYFSKEQSKSKSLVLYYHGGGFVFGDLDTHDPVCRFICNELNTQVLSVEYRLAPEFLFPTAIDDGFAAYQWAIENAEKFGVDPKKIIVAGDSAGGNIASVISQMARNQSITPPMAQFLIYPATDRKNKYPSQKFFNDGLILTGKDLKWFEDLYAPDVSHDDFRVSPLHAETLNYLAPAFIVTAALDPLRDEGEAYAKALEAAGVKVKSYRAPGMVHGFIHSLGYGKAAQGEFSKSLQLLKEFISQI